MPPKSNVALLTEGADYIRRAKKARQDQVEAVKWDDENRRDYLTGFSKRKKQRTDERRARAKKREHEAHLEERRKARAELRERAKQNVRDVRMALGLSVDDEDAEDDDEEEEEKAPIETNFSDDEQLATVTITEDFDFTGGERAYVDSEDEDEAAPKKKPLVPLLPASSRRAEQKAKREKAAAEAKERARKDTRAAEKKSTSMETPAERRRAKELEARKRAKKLEKEKKQAEKYGITLIKGRPGGGKGGKPGKPGKPGKGGKGKPAGKKGGKR